MDIDVEMHLSEDLDVWAYGMVTLEQNLKFPVQLRKIMKDGETTSFISYPRRERNGNWENVLLPNASVREEIQLAVGKKIKELMGKQFDLPEVEVLSISPIVPRYPPKAKAYICGVASVEVYGITIHGITIKKGQKGYFVNMPQYKKADGYHDVVYATTKQMQEQIANAVLQEYYQEMGLTDVPNFGTQR